MTRGRVAVIACLVAWAAAAAYGGYRLLAAMPDRVQQARVDETAMRNQAWSPIYGFGQACAGTMPSRSSVLLVDPTGRPPVAGTTAPTGPASFGAPNDLDWPNQAAFAYAIYPREVDDLGHLPNVDVAAKSAGFLAVWSQVAYRSAAARSDADSFHRALAGGGQMTLVCSYSDAAGDRGWLYAGPGAAPPIRAIAADPPSLSAAGLIAVLVGLSVLWLIGRSLLAWLGMGKIEHGLAAATSLPLGCIAVSLEMLVTSVGGLRWSLALLVSPWIALWAVQLWFHRTKLSVAGLTSALQMSYRRLSENVRLIGRIDAAILAAIVFLLALITIGSPLGLPVSDGFSMYFFKAQAFYVDGGVLDFYRNAGAILFSFPAHPPLVPLNVTWLYMFIGHVEERSAELLWPALYASAIGALYGLVRTVSSRRVALCFALAGTLIPYELSVAALRAGYTDLPLATYLLLGAGMLWIWSGSQRRDPRMVVLAGALLGGAVLTKEEGLVGALAVGASSVILAWRGIGWARLAGLLRSLAPAALVVGAVTVIWFAIRVHYKLPVLTVDLAPRLDYLAHRVPGALLGLGVRAAPHMAIVAMLVGGAAAVSVRLRSLGRRFWFLTTTVLLIGTADVLAIAAAHVDVNYQVSVAGGRIISQAMLLVLLLLVEPWRNLLSKSSGSNASTSRSELKSV